MAIGDRIRGAGAILAGVAGDALSGLADRLTKATPPPRDEEEEEEEAPEIVVPGRQQGGNTDDLSEHAPGGTSEDTALGEPVPTDKATKEPKTLFWDPFAIIEQLGYRDRPSPITYGTLKAIFFRTPVVAALIQLRINQIASFSSVSHDRYSLGFRIKARDTEKESTPAERKWAQQCETLLMRTGVTDNPRGRDNMEEFLRKLAWDTLIYDQMCFEIVPNKKGIPAEWYAIDASTIRIADTASLQMNEDLDKTVRYVQIYDQMIIAEYTQEELCFGIRNPRSDLRAYNYGVSELEIMMQTVTSMLWAWEYNQRAFSQGSVHKGILNFKGAVPEKQMKAFQRHWYTMLSGVENAWRTPITNAEDLQWISMHQSSRDMEYNAWMDFLIKVVCSIYQTDPVELNFKYGNAGQKSTMNEQSNREKITESRERGLRPLLRFMATQINQHIIWPMNENFEFAFVGLDSKTQDEVADLNQKRVKTFRTVDELRAEDDLPPLPDGEGAVLLDPVWMQARNMKQQQEQQQAFMEQGLGPDGQPVQQPGEPDAEGEDGEKPDFQKLLAGHEAGDEDDDEEDDAGPPKKGPPGKAKAPPFIKKSIEAAYNAATPAGKRKMRKALKKGLVIEVEV